MIYQQRNSPETAIQFYQKALAIDDTDAVVWYQLGKLCFESFRLALARRALEKSVSLSPTFIIAWYMLMEV